MRKLCVVVFTAGLLFAQSFKVPYDGTPHKDDKGEQVWTGTLFDAGCKDSIAPKTCEVSENTTEFGLRTGDGASFTFDPDGNAKIRSALQAKNRKNGPVTVTLKGRADGKTIKVEAVQIH